MQLTFQQVDEFIIPLFEMALQEINYPPTWMKELPLHPSDFPEKVEAAFGKDFIARYENAEKEFKTLPQRRLYCRHIVDPEDGKKPKPGDTANENRFKDLREVPLTQRAWRARQRFQACGGFLSAKIPESAYSSVPEPQGRFIALTRLLRGFASGEGAPCSLLALTSTCNSCLGKSYACCGEPILADDSHNETPRQSIERQHREVHVCKSDEQGEHVDLGVRGVDYQLCPRPLCKRPIQLKVRNRSIQAFPISEIFANLLKSRMDAITVSAFVVWDSASFVVPET